MTPKDQSPSEGVDANAIEIAKLRDAATRCEGWGMYGVTANIREAADALEAAISERTKGEAVDVAYEVKRLEAFAQPASRFNSDAIVVGLAVAIATIRKITATHPPAADVRGDWVVVPRIPTPEMLTAGALYADSYADLIAAAPKPEGV